MKPFNSCIFAVGCLFFGCNGVNQPSAAERAVDQFHQDYDARNFEAIYVGAHPDFKVALPRDKLIAVFESKRTKLGKVERTSMIESHEKSEDQDSNLVLTYSTTFENGSRKEVFVYGIETEEATLIGWHLGSTVPS